MQAWILIGWELVVAQDMSSMPYPYILILFHVLLWYNWQDEGAAPALGWTLWRLRTRNMDSGMQATWHLPVRSMIPFVGPLEG